MEEIYDDAFDDETTKVMTAFFMERGCIFLCSDLAITLDVSALSS
jgi:hypothetical protein